MCICGSNEIYNKLLRTIVILNLGRLKVLEEEEGIRGKSQKLICSIF